MKFNDLVKMVYEANEAQAPAAEAQAPAAPTPSQGQLAKAVTVSSGQEDSKEGEKIYFCEVATKAIDNANKNKGMFPYMDRVIAQYADGIKKLQASGVGKINYATLKKESIEGDTYEFVDVLELPNGEKVEHWPIALSIEIDDTGIQKEMSETYRHMELRNIANKEAGGGEAGKRAEDFLDALG
jgi:hypothetical protein